MTNCGIIPSKISTIGPVLVLGYFNRHNIGDDSYTLVYDNLFEDVTCLCTDDCTEIPADVSTVIVGGGDIVCPYFMDKLKILTKDFAGHMYALSVGIPFQADARYLTMFDHCFMRSQRDLRLAQQEAGEANCSYIPDLAFSLCAPPKQLDADVLRVGLCLAQPAFRQNQDFLISQICTFIHTLLTEYDDTEVLLIPFNTSDSQQESDSILNDKVETMYTRDYAASDRLTSVTSVTELGDLLTLFATLDLVVGMRFHQLIFSLLSSVKFVSLYSTTKVESLLKDTGCTRYGYKLPLDEQYRPTYIDPDIMEQLVLERLQDQSTPTPLLIEQPLLNALSIISTGKNRVVDTIYPDHMETTDIVMHRAATYLALSPEVREAWFNGELSTVALTESLGKTHQEMASMSCFAVTGGVGQMYEWGMAENLQKEDFNLREAMSWVAKDWLQQSSPIIKPFAGPTNVSIDLNYFLQDNYKGLHRSGWSFVLSALSFMDTTVTRKTATIKVDTCIDRTFHWGKSTLLFTGILPYRSKWMGFLHHTFDESYSYYNNVELFRDPVFLASLQSCRCIVTLTQYLAEQVTAALAAAGFPGVRVAVIPHPMEDVPLHFSMEQFIGNPCRKVVQVGAWLRNSYSIYDLPLPLHNPLHIQKAALKGRDMDNYFKPAGLLEGIASLAAAAPSGVSRGSLQRGIVYSNKYAEGLLKEVQANDRQVQVLSQLTNQQYDELLSENIVFLDLLDCQAVNTVLECLIRNTPLIVNRHPAIEEVLGAGYPGFYSSKFEAVQLLCDEQQITRIHTYLASRSKEEIQIDHFVALFQSLVGELQ